LEPEVAPPVEKPPPVQLDAWEEDQESVDGTPVEGLAESEQVGGVPASTAMVAHGPQLLP
jgi:hypothetical protein